MSVESAWLVVKYSFSIQVAEADTFLVWWIWGSLLWKEDALKLQKEKNCTLSRKIFQKSQNETIELESKRAKITSCMT